ncbi:hypothetical protein PAXRUDRAFT_12720 [Paxillus rubicundulus Ve08.2h10]|uniref:Uncharacterized protein n=1 Tax=Paxillus rubicundulus Ve08.2h10 TaxID=930991 RepID=A0A0D0E6I0_9AGAM|nr:hypothetical protein PAXRUDRAFT_12720 [Paxillus rubicundulus Ve08.2h10]
MPMLTNPLSVQHLPPPRLLYNRINPNRAMGITDRADPRLDRVIILGDGSLAARTRRTLDSRDREARAQETWLSIQLVSPQPHHADATTAMTAMPPFYQVFVDVYHLILSSWNACLVLLQVIRLTVNEAQQEVAQLMEMLDDDGPMMRMATSYDPADPWQMLIVSRATSFVLLLRLSKSRVLHLEVDERFVASKFEVIKTDLLLSIQHVSHWLQPPIGMHDTRLIKYTPMNLPYLWKEHCDAPRAGGVTGTLVASNAGSEGRAQRKRAIEVLTESAARRRNHLDCLEQAKMETDTRLQRTPATRIHAPMRATELRKVLVKTLGESTVKRQVLGSTTNGPSAGTTHANTVANEDSEGTPPAHTAAHTPKQVRMERQIHTALTENLSIRNIVQAASLRKRLENVDQPRQMTIANQTSAGGSVRVKSRRKHGGYDIYTQGVPSSFSLLSNLNIANVEGGDA